MKPKRFSLGIDPDLTVLSMVLIDHDDPRPKVLCSKNPTSKNERLTPAQRVALAALEIRDLVDNAFTHYRKVGLWDAFIEDQYVSRHSNANPNDLLALSKIAGIWLGVLTTKNIDCHLILPARWKGNCPKGIAQSRTLVKLKIDFTMIGGREPYPVPEDIPSLVPPHFLIPNKGDFKDINDSMGLAVWGKEQSK